MDISLLLKGTLLGFSLAAPIGPIAIICIRRTLQHGRFSGFVSGLGVATVDTIYATIAAFGFTAVSAFITRYNTPMRIIGGMFLIYLAIKIFFAKPPLKESDEKKHNHYGDYFSIFLLTIVNPQTIFTFLVLFTTVGLGSGHFSYLSTVLMIVGVSLGTTAWWLILSTIVYLFRNKFSPFWMSVVNKLSAIIIIGFALMSWISLK